MYTVQSPVLRNIRGYSKRQITDRVNFYNEKGILKLDYSYLQIGKLPKFKSSQVNSSLGDYCY